MPDENDSPQRSFFRSLSDDGEGEGGTDPSTDASETIPPTPTPSPSHTGAQDEEGGGRRRKRGVLFDPERLDDEGDDVDGADEAAFSGGPTPEAEEAARPDGSVPSASGDDGADETSRAPTLDDLREGPDPTSPARPAEGSAEGLTPPAEAAQPEATEGATPAARHVPSPEKTADVEAAAHAGAGPAVEDGLIEDTSYWDDLGAALREERPDPETDLDEVMHLVRGDRVYREGPEETEDGTDEGDESIAATSSGPSLGREFLGWVIANRTHLALWARRVLVGVVLTMALAFVATRLPFGSYGKYYIHFSIQAGGVESVTVVGDFNDWDPDADSLARIPNTPTWETWIRVSPGRYRYAFLVDGKHRIIDPARPADDVSSADPVSTIHVPEGGGTPQISNEFRSARIHSP